VDEMDLASQSLEVTPWRPEEYERARAVLRGAMAESEYPRQAAPMPEVISLRERGSSRMGNRRRKTMGTRGKIGIGAGIGAVAAAVAAVLVVTSTPQAATPTSQSGAPTGSAAKTPAVTSPLMTLAADIKAGDHGSKQGDASLVIAHKSLGPKVVEVVYALYTDSGALYLGDDKKTLRSEVVKNENQADSLNASDVAAARYAASADLASARKRMVNASSPTDYYLSYAARKKIWDKNLPALKALLREKGSKVVPQMPTGQALTDLINIALWNGCQDALQWAANDPQARAGVMRLLSTIPDLTVVHSMTDGQPTLTITAGAARFQGIKQVLTVSATTGLQISSVSSGAGMSTGGETDTDSRVTVADIKANKF
jgi:hypothetical protein